MKKPLIFLLIDDNPDDRALALRKLKQEFSAFQAIEISSGQELERELTCREFDLVITDYQLRWMDGLDVLRQVKTHAPDCPVVMFTGTGSEEVAVEAMKSGLDDYIIKSPQHYARLAVAVRAALERAAQRQALREVQIRYQELFERVPIGLYRLSTTGKFLEANPALLQLLGYKNWQALLNSEITQHQTDTKANSILQSRIEREGVVKDFEMPMRRCDGTLIWVRHNSRSVCNENGELLYYEGAIEDITKRKQVENERIQLLIREQEARAEAETANRLKDEFLATLSHELRTPLNAIVGWSSLLRKQQLNPEKTARAIEIIERNAQAQAQLIEDLLDVSRIIRGKLQLNIYPVDLQQITLAALDTVKPAAEAKQIQLEFLFEPVTGNIKGDRDRLQQIIWNLLSNAIKFTPVRGSVSVRLNWLENYVQIQVKDNGKGIVPEVVPYIFERFRQAESTTTRSQGGLGLGLAIVRHLVELHGGKVWCESSGLGTGAIFTVQLPTLNERKARVGNPQQANPPASSNPQFLLQDLRVLVVEDEIDSLEFLTTVLEQEGAKVTAAKSVQEALQVLTQLSPDVLVSDIAMPGQDGYSLIRQIRKVEANGEQFLPAIALTAYAQESDEQKAFQAGFQVHLTKPFEPNDLVAAILQLTN
ncbi:response regulator [Lyngbya aestuarii]|uniref:response regulator n=1 Tax=Lyngbya aestuarii TaxID=118322 RepID=UPI00403D5B1D